MPNPRVLNDDDWSQASIYGVFLQSVPRTSLLSTFHDFLSTEVSLYCLLSTTGWLTYLFELGDFWLSSEIFGRPTCLICDVMEVIKDPTHQLVSKGDFSKIFNTWIYLNVWCVMHNVWFLMCNKRCVMKYIMNPTNNLYSQKISKNILHMVVQEYVMSYVLCTMCGLWYLMYNQECDVWLMVGTTFVMVGCLFLRPAWLTVPRSFRHIQGARGRGLCWWINVAFYWVLDNYWVNVLHF